MSTTPNPTPPRGDDATPTREAGPAGPVKPPLDARPFRDLRRPENSPVERARRWFGNRSPR